MKKNVLVAGIVFATVIILFSTAPVLAAPKEKVDFALYIQGALPSSTWLHENGYIRVSPDNRWPLPPPPPEGPAVRHYFDAPFNPTNVWLVIDGTEIPYSRLSYTAAISGELHFISDTQNWRVHETVTIYTDSSKTTVWGTIEIRCVAQYDIPEASPGVPHGTFEGHGTGPLEGVKVKGYALSRTFSGVSTRAREGIAMGWP